ncbi:MAG TPA: FAD-dependent monooxygenase [Candidatus Binataceae bacterium]|nr:FAD-dependent monooxygenase [Candidatus Binataceae bacterium]
MSQPLESEVFVVGGGPAGLAAAIAARLAGFEVALADHCRPPIDKACGEGILPGGVAALRRLGVRLDGEEAFALRGIRFTDHGVTAEAKFGAGPALGVRRTMLHRALVERAGEVGVKLLYGQSVRAAHGTQIALAGTPVRSRWLVVADGLQSRTRGALGLDRISTRSRRVGFRRHYRIEPWSDLVEVLWRPGAQAYVTPVARDEVGVALLSDDPELRFAHLERLFPELSRRLADAAPASRVRGAITVSSRVACVARDQVALIGDASGSVDAITGDGLSLAFEQSLALGDALAGGDLSLYARAHARICRAPRLVGALLLALARHDRIRSRALGVLGSRQWLFDQLLAIHAGELPLPGFGADSIAALMRRVTAKAPAAPAGRG